MGLVQAAVREQALHIGKALGIGVVQRDIGAAGCGLAIADGGKVRGSGGHGLKVCVHVLQRGHGVGLVDGVNALCADGVALGLAAVDGGHPHAQILVACRLYRVLRQVEHAGQLHAQAVPVADGVADLDLHHSIVAVGLAAAQQAGCAQYGGRCTGALEEAAAGNDSRHKIYPP